MDKLFGKPQIGFVQLTKFNEADGTFEGVMASSTPDQSNEVLDWSASRPHFNKWIRGAMERSRGKSCGNVREMHQPIAAGILTKVHFDQDNERFYVWGQVTNGSTRDKVATGTLTGLSIGGDYGKRWPDPLNPKLTRYEAKPYEVSLVDNPCNPDAVLMVAQADGSEKMVKFAANAIEWEAAQDEFEDEEPDLAKGDRPDTSSSYAYAPGPNKSDWKFPIHDAAHVKNALARFGQDKGIPDAARKKVWSRILAAARRFGVKVSNPSYTSKGEFTMSNDEIVAQELHKQEEAKAVKFAVLGDLVERIKKLRKRFKKFGESGGLNKTYVSTISGYLNDLSGQIQSLQSSFTPAVAAGMPASPGNGQPGENVGGGDGSMVTASPSSSGTGQMVPGAGVRAAVGGKGKKGMKKLKKLVLALAESQSTMEKRVAESLVALLKPPTDAEIKALADRGVVASGGSTVATAPVRPAMTTPAGTGGAPVRLVKDAADAGKVAEAAAGKADEPSDMVIAGLQKIANDPTDPIAASRAVAELNKISGAAVSDALRTTAKVPMGEAGFRDRTRSA